MTELEFAGFVFLLGKELANQDGLSWEDPWKQDCLDRAADIAEWLEDEGWLKE